MDVGAALVADGEAAEAADPGECALDHPAVSSQTLAVLDAAPGDAGNDVALAAFAPAALVIVGFVGVPLAGPAAGPPARALEWGHGVQHGFHHGGVVAVGPGQADGQRSAVAVGEDMALGARTPTVGGTV